jgi:hypothetical protein
MADIANMSEEKRLAVNAFLKRAVGSLCEKYGATVLVLGHPSKTSMNDGTMYSGSTAFNNAVRNRTTLTAPDGIKKPKHILEAAKINYSKPCEMELFLFDKVFLTLRNFDATAAHRREEEAVLSTVKGLLCKGIQINRGNGNGQKPRDIATEVSKKHGLSVTPHRVLEILNAAERRGELRYQAAHGKQRAGFLLPDGVISSEGAGSSKLDATVDTVIDHPAPGRFSEAIQQAVKDNAVVAQATAGVTGQHLDEGKPLP